MTTIEDIEDYNLLMGLEGTVARCIIDHTILLAFHRGQFKDKDFIKLKGEIHLKYEKSSVYYNVFFKVLIDYKTEIFKYVQQYYRCFMGKKSAQQLPNFVYQ